MEGTCDARRLSASRFRLQPNGLLLLPLLLSILPPLLPLPRRKKCLSTTLRDHTQSLVFLTLPGITVAPWLRNCIDSTDDKPGQSAWDVRRPAL
jgi:hypothetical protein